MNMFRLSYVLLAISAVLSVAVAQSTLSPCNRVCRRLRGRCDVSLLDLSRTECFDTKTNQERTCDCGITTLQQLANLKEGEVLRDCVIPRRLFNFNSAITINADLINVHAVGISNVGTLRQSGDISRSTICDWKCVGRNRFQNCVIAGRVIRSTFDVLSAEQEATLSIGGLKFIRNKVKFLRSDKNIQIGCKEGFDANSVETLAMPNFGLFSTVAGTFVRKNRFDQMVLGKVSSFATFEGNTARIATAEGPCSVLNRGSKIEVEDFLAIPNDQCQNLFTKI